MAEKSSELELPKSLDDIEAQFMTRVLRADGVDLDGE